MKEDISFTEQIRIALSKPLWYKSLFQQSLKKHVCYFLILIVLTTVIRSVIPTAAYIQSVGGLQRLLLEGIPTFSFTNGELTVDEVVDIERNGVQLYIDTSKESYTLEDAKAAAAGMDDSFALVYLVSRTNMVCNQVSVPYSFQELQGFTLDNQIVYQIAPAYLIFSVLFAFFYNMAAYLFSALFFAVFGYLINRVLNLKLRFGQIYLIAMYAKSVQILLEAVLEVAGFSLLYYIGSIAGIFITCNYMTRGMSSFLLPSVKTGDDNLRE